MKTSRAGIDLIRKWEGCRLTAYPDPGTGGEPWTIGYGHTSAAGAPLVKKGMKITQQEADDILVRDLVKYESAVMKALTVLPTQNQFDAMVSLCYNIGPGAFAGSSVVKKFNASNISGAADAFRLWNKAGGKVMQGLVNRREDERKHFLRTAVRPVEPLSPPPPPDVPPVAEPVPAPTAGPTIAKWVIGLVGAAFAAFAAWLMKG